MGSLYTTVGLSAAALVLVAPRIKDPSTQRVASYGILLVAFMAYRCARQCGWPGRWVCWGSIKFCSCLALLHCPQCWRCCGTSPQQCTLPPPCPCRLITSNHVWKTGMTSDWYLF